MRLTLDGSELSTSSRPFTYHDEDVPPSLFLAEPNEADAHNAVLLTVWGHNFAPAQARHPRRCLSSPGCLQRAMAPSRHDFPPKSPLLNPERGANVCLLAGEAHGMRI